MSIEGPVSNGDDRGLPTGSWLDDTPGATLIRFSWVGTAVFVAFAVAGLVWGETIAVLVAVVDLTLFAAGTVAFLWAYAVAVGRSRTDLMGIGGLFFLADSAPRRVQMAFMIPLALQVVVAIATASARLYTALAFGALVPMYGLGLAGLWGAKYGEFPPRVAEGDGRRTLGPGEPGDGG